jgi:predicted nucleic acid-binding protein
MRLYLDLCVYNRPFDDQAQPRIALETMDFLVLIDKAEKAEIELVNSFALEEENSRSPFIDRRDMIADMLMVASDYVQYDDTVKARAKAIEKIGLMGMDALHIACAEKAGADFFVTCDDTLVKKCKSNEGDLKVKVISLLRFIAEEVFES